MSRGSDELERGIEANRSRLNGALGELQRRLTPSGIVEDMLGHARRSDVGKGFYDDTLDTVRRNPIPVLMVCLGALLLFRASAGASDRTHHPAEAEPVPARMPSQLDRARSPAPPS